MIEVNNLLSPGKDTIIDESIICPKCKQSDRLKVVKFSYNIKDSKYNDEAYIGCTRCWLTNEINGIKVTEEEYTEVRKRLRFSWV